MTRAITYTQAQLRRNIKAALSAGLRVTGIRPDGAIETTDGEGPADVATDSGKRRLASWDDE